MPTYYGRSYRREEIAGYLQNMSPELRRTWVSYVVRRVSDLVGPKHRARASDYVQTAIAGLCNPALPPIFLDPEKHITGLAIQCARRVFLKEVVRAKREAETLVRRASAIAEAFDPKNRFPEKKWALFQKVVSTLDDDDQELLNTVVEEKCFRVGTKRVQIDNQRVATLLNRSPREVARSVERLREVIRKHDEFDDEEGEDQ